MLFSKKSSACGISFSPKSFSLSAAHGSEPRPNSVHRSPVYWLPPSFLLSAGSQRRPSPRNRIMPLEGGLYQWAKFGFNDFTGFIVAWNLWLLLGLSLLMAGVGLVIATNLSYAICRWMRRGEISYPHSIGALIAALILVTIRGFESRKWVHNSGAILLLGTYAASVPPPFLARSRRQRPIRSDLILREVCRLLARETAGRRVRCTCRGAESRQSYAPICQDSDRES